MISYKVGEGECFREGTAKTLNLFREAKLDRDCMSGEDISVVSTSGAAFK